MQMQNRGTLFGGGIVMVVLGIIFFILPAFLFVGIIGAVAATIILFVLRLFH